LRNLQLLATKEVGQIEVKIPAPVRTLRPAMASNCPADGTEEIGSDGMSGSETSRTSPEAAALAGRRAGKSLREIAIDLYGREQVDADWHADSPLRSKLRRLLCWTEARSGAGPHDAGPGSA